MKKVFVFSVSLLLGACFILTGCATDAVMTQKQAAEQRQKEVEAAKKQKEQLQKQMDEAVEKLEEQAEAQKNAADQ